MDSDELLTLGELADYLKLKPRTVYSKVWAGEVPAIKVFGQWRFRKSDIEKWLTENTKINQPSFKNITDETQQPQETSST